MATELFPYLVGALGACIAALAMWQFNTNKAHDDRMLSLASENGALREALTAHRVEVAREYATNGYIQDVEKRLTEHLVRIEAKLDVRAAKNAGGMQ